MVSGQLTAEVTWTPQEQAILEEGLNKYDQKTGISYYAKIAKNLANKTIKDVALRMTEKRMGPFATGRYDDGIINNAIDGEIGKLLEKNSQALQKIHANLNGVFGEKQGGDDNIALFFDIFRNINKILSSMENLQDRMDPLPVTLNEELLMTHFPFLCSQ